jgi:hypothetical protein
MDHEPAGHEAEAFAPVAVTGTVKVDGSVPVVETAADFGSYITYVLAGTEIPQRILRQDKRRARAYITVTGTGPVFIGTESQCEAIKAGAPQTTGMVTAGLIATGITMPVTHQQEVWLVPDGTHGATVTVATERWA